MRDRRAVMARRRGRARSSDGAASTSSGSHARRARPAARVCLRTRSTRSPRSHELVFSPGKVETMISSTARRRRPGPRPRTGRGARSGRARRSPRRGASASARRSRRSASGMRRSASGRSAARRAGSSPAPPARASRIVVEQRLADDGLVRDHEHVPRLAALGVEVDDDVLDGQAAGAAFSIFSSTCLRSQPDFSCGWVETTISVTGGSSWASASRTASTGVGVDDEARAPGCRPRAARRACGRAGAPPPRGACPRRRRSRRSAARPGRRP